MRFLSQTGLPEINPRDVSCRAFFLRQARSRSTFNSLPSYLRRCGRRVQEGKLTCSEELGNFLKQHDLQLALAVYVHGECSARVVEIFAETNEFEKIIQYANAVKYKPDYIALLRHISGVNPKGASDFAIKLATNPTGPLVDAGEVMELFYQRNMIPELTALMIDVLAKNDPADSKLQTRFLEILLQKAPNVADAIFGKSLYSQYDRTYIAQCCEKAHLYQRALEHYTEPADILRCIVNTNMINPEFLIQYFGSPVLSKERGLEALKARPPSPPSLPLASCCEVINVTPFLVLPRSVRAGAFEEPCQRPACRRHRQEVHPEVRRARARRPLRERKDVRRSAPRHTTPPAHYPRALWR